MQQVRNAMSLLIVMTLFWIMPGQRLMAQEHPTEHPTSTKQASLTKEGLAEAITAYVQNETKLKGGYFLVYDGKSKQPLALKLDKVHKDRLSTIGNNVYFACADFKTPANKTYDLDIFMKGSDTDHFQVTDISVHKEAGQARYTWYEEGGVWKKKPVQ